MKRIKGLWIILAALALLLTACGDNNDKVGVTISPVEKTIEPGESVTLTVTPSGGTKVVWPTLTAGQGSYTTPANNTTIYTPPSTPATYSFTVAAAIDPTKTATAEITVKAPDAPAAIISIDPPEKTIFIGESVELQVTVSNATVVWPTLTDGQGSYTEPVDNKTTYTPPATAGIYSFTVAASTNAAKTAVATITVQKKPETPFTGVVFTGKSTPKYSATYAIEYTDWTVIKDGEVKTVKVLPDATTYEPIYLTASTGVYQSTNEYDAAIVEIKEKVVAYPGIVEGYSFKAATGNKIKLGAKETEYTFAEGAKVYRLDSQASTTNFALDIANIPTSWNGHYWLLLNSNDEIRYLFLSYVDATTPDPCAPYGFSCASPDSTKPTAANLAQLAIVKKFDSAVGPEANDLTTEYAYFKPTDAGGKLPLVIWLHGSGEGSSVYRQLIAPVYAGLTRFADEYQSLFAGGGAYIMVPRSNEDFAAGHGMRWNDKQIDPLLAAIDDFIAKNPNIDTKRIYIGGFSIGAGEVWSVIRERTGFFAAAFPVAPPARFMPEPTSDEISDFATLPIWVIHSYQDTTVPVKDDDLGYGSKMVMDAIMALTASNGTDSRISFLHPFYNLGSHQEVTAVFNNMMWPGGGPNLPALYGVGDKDATASSLPITERVPSTLIDWLNEQHN